MKFIKNRFAPWPIVLLIGIAVLAISLAARVSPSTIAADREEQLVQPAANVNENTDSTNSKASEVTVGRGVLRQDYYDRRREYWEDRVDRRLDDEESDDEAGDEKNAKDEKADKDDSAESDLDKEEELIEKRREYWRDRLDREW